jgi:hypothetical protein
MTLRYVQITSAESSAAAREPYPATQEDLQREFHLARQDIKPHSVPVLSIPNCADTADVSRIHQALTATRHLLEMYRRGLITRKLDADSNDSTGGSSTSVNNWITSPPPKNEERLAGQVVHPGIVSNLKKPQNSGRFCNSPPTG